MNMLTAQIANTTATKTTRLAPAASTQARMLEFKDFWQTMTLPWQLEDLTQEQIEVVKKLASKAFSAGKKVGKRL